MDRYLTADDLAKTLRRDVRDGLTATPKTLPPKWFYDERGSALFEEITRLDEYYPTRREREILAARASDIAAATGAETLLELGAGSGEKTRLLLDALDGTLRSYVPVDVSGDFLAEAAGQIAADHPGLAVRPVVADYEQHLHLLPGGRRRLIAFLGGTIGNMPPGARVGFLGGLRAGMADGDALLLGADLVKDERRLVRAYDDAAGVTAAFNRNVLHVVNRELDADFDPGAFEHVALWDAEREWIEMRLRSARDQAVRIGGLDLAVSFAAGEEMRTEISAKFRRERLEDELRAAGLALAEFWTDSAGDFSLSLARPA
ncbi:L-histidine N(alpha)-methyltransferase [Actinomadura miaoliensis]|uniref:Histidine N-alpha-methyltransferase n=1 Tax=Actinomadura miaoliensis TaxID=430685 RepID=A0ABP7WH70_9ACTN